MQTADKKTRRLAHGKENDNQISMDGKERALDNIRIERLWRSLKYEDIYLAFHGQESVMTIRIRKSKVKSSGTMGFKKYKTV